MDVCFRPDSLGWARKGGSSVLGARMFMFKGPVLAMGTSQAKTKTKIQIHIPIPMRNPQLELSTSHHTF